MKRFLAISKPFFIGILIASGLYFFTKWWVFLVIFPWVGLSITLGTFLISTLKGKKRLLGRKISILMILPCLLIFVPVINNENFQLEGIVLIVSIGFFSKGFIHYAVAKIFGPLIWGRGFCGWACWTAAVLDWLPMKKCGSKSFPQYKAIRYFTLLISLIIPLYLIVVLNYDVEGDYLYKEELTWMFVGNLIYYLIAIPLAFIMKDNRAFCKYVCPVSLVMKPATSLSLIKIAPSGNDCIECGKCNSVCPMNVDVMTSIKNKKRISDSECILCVDCKIVCPKNAIK